MSHNIFCRVLNLSSMILRCPGTEWRFHSFSSATTRTQCGTLGADGKLWERQAVSGRREIIEDKF